MMKNHPTPHQKDVEADGVPRTPNGARILVFETPQLAAQNNAATAADVSISMPSPRQSLTPLIVQNSFESQAPATPLPATQPGLRLQRDDASLGTPDEESTRERELTGLGLTGAFSGTGTSQSPDDAPSALLTPIRLTQDGRTDDGSATAVEESPDSTPINVSWNTVTSAAMVSPTTRTTDATAHAGFAARAENARSGIVQAAEPRTITTTVTAILAGGAAAAEATTGLFTTTAAMPASPGTTRDTPPVAFCDTAALRLAQQGDELLVDATSEPAYDGGRAAAHIRTPNAQSVEPDYFRFFTTPPVFGNTSQNRAERRSQGKRPVPTTDPAATEADVGRYAGPGGRATRLSPSATGGIDSGVEERRKALKREMRRL
ncbi:hypothetical protein C8T65DRAFT_738350 [Cerioporus squamosus]|nr:hypothetical protein C8T65DRAFT_738350 [Cerioporus squamosus]